MTKIKKWFLRQIGAVGLVGLAVIVGLMVVVIVALSSVSENFSKKQDFAGLVVKAFSAISPDDCPGIVDLVTRELIDNIYLIYRELNNYYNLLPSNMLGIDDKLNKCVVMMDDQCRFVDNNLVPGVATPGSKTYVGCLCDLSGILWQVIRNRCLSLDIRNTYVVLALFVEKDTCSIYGETPDQQSPYILACAATSTESPPYNEPGSGPSAGPSIGGGGSGP